jgi:hypothetical protein
VVTERIDFRNELRDVWEDWVHEVPLADMLEEIWERLPRIGKNRALKWARNEVAAVRGWIPPRYKAPTVDSEAPRLIAPPGYDEEVRRPPRPRRPPWPTRLFRAATERGLIEYHEKSLVQLLALSRIFALAGLHFSVLQPSDKALENARFYDEGM